MVVGVSTGFEKRMEMVGTGYRASVAGKELTLNVGYSKPRVLAIPDGITVKVRTLPLLLLLMLSCSDSCRWVTCIHACECGWQQF
jgi:large subunit ribosomal protein L6